MTWSLTLAALIALVQYDADAHFGDRAHNVEALTAYAEEAVASGARMVVFPEGSTLGYVGAEETWCSGGRSSCYDRRCRDVSLVAETLPGGPTTTHWATFARDHGVYVVYAAIEQDRGRFYNAIGVVGPEGFVTRYRKRALYGPDYCYATAGSETAMLETEYGRFGLGICADANSDSLFSGYKSRGADGVIIPMEWDQDPDGSRSARVFFQSKARSHGIDVYGADAPAWDGTGKYPAGARDRVRDGMPPEAVGEEGMTMHALGYRP